MAGEEIAAARVAAHGLAGDRAHTLVDGRDGGRRLSARAVPGVLEWAASCPEHPDDALEAVAQAPAPGDRTRRAALWLRRPGAPARARRRSRSPGRAVAPAAWRARPPRDRAGDLRGDPPCRRGRARAPARSAAVSLEPAPRARRPPVRRGGVGGEADRGREGDAARTRAVRALRRPDA